MSDRKRTSKFERIKNPWDKRRLENIRTGDTLA